jgi:hypothetical protein
MHHRLIYANHQIFSVSGNYFVIVLIHSGPISGMFWRYMINDDPTVDRFIVRDSDSIASYRERLAVNEWIMSGKKFHIMRDHYYHGLPIMGGMWGGRKHAFNREEFNQNVLRNIHRFSTYKGGDQVFLEQFYASQVKPDMKCHDSYWCHYYAGCEPWPSRRQSPSDYVGSVKTSNVYDDADLVMTPKPIYGFVQDLLTKIHPSLLLYRPGGISPLQCRKKPQWLAG